MGITIWYQRSSILLGSGSIRQFDRGWWWVRSSVRSRLVVRSLRGRNPHPLVGTPNPSVDLAPKRRPPTAVQAQISAAMEGIEQHNAETRTKMDEIAEQLKGITAWMQSMEATTQTLTTSASLLQLHAEDASTRLSALESPLQRPPIPSGLASSSTAPPTVEVRSIGVDRPYGHGGQHQQRGPVLGDPQFPTLPPAHGTFPPNRPLHDLESVHGERRAVRSSFGSTPKMDLPKFDGGRLPSLDRQLRAVF